MRNDLESLTPGRAAAQASHASNAFIHTFGKRSDVKKWQRQTKQGFGTAIVLSVNNFELGELMRESNSKGWIHNLVLDPDYVTRIPVELSKFLVGTVKILEETSDGKTVAFSRIEVPCGYIFGEKEVLSPTLEKFPLF